MTTFGRHTRSRLARWALAFALALTATTARAEDYWLEFQPLQPEAGSELAVSLWLGKDFVPEAQQAMQQARTVALRHISRVGDVDLLPRTREGVLPLLRLRLASPGGHLLSLERDAARVQLRARTFNRYLEDEGLLAALEHRKRAGELWHRGNERYTRYVKAFVQVGDVADGVSTQVVGQRLELVPDRDLAGLKAGERIGMRVLFEGRPLANAQVEAFVRGGSGGATAGQLGSTDASGRVEFTVSGPGTVLVRTVHMQRCVGCSDGAQWESFWAAYSFAAR
jgi:Domain of unknown function (DUF4198)